GFGGCQEKDIKKDILSPTVKQSDEVVVWVYKKNGVNASNYNNLLAANLLSFINELNVENCHNSVDGVFIFQDDNAPYELRKTVLFNETGEQKVEVNQRNLIDKVLA
ncbi:8340_t:CDS:2, partial [Entrophospora sp. SA101]